MSKCIKVFTQQPRELKNLFRHRCHPAPRRGISSSTLEHSDSLRYPQRRCGAILMFLQMPQIKYEVNLSTGFSPKENIRKVLREVKTDKHCKGYNTRSRFLSMMFCQFSNYDSVCDISNGLNLANGKLLSYE